MSVLEIEDESWPVKDKDVILMSSIGLIVGFVLAFFLYLYVRKRKRGEIPYV